MYHLYCRVSTLEQNAPGKTSIEEQEKLCRAAALLQGHKTPQIWYDIGISGSMPLIKRPAGNRMLEALAPGDLIVTATFKRLFSSAADALDITQRIFAAEVDAIVIDLGTEPIMASHHGEFFLKMLAAFAELERGRFRESIIDGKRAKKARGGSVGGQTPYGYRLVGKDQVVPCEAEMWMVGRARVLRAGGFSLQRVADHLNEAGYRTRRGTAIQARQVLRWLTRPAVPEEATASRPEPAMKTLVEEL